MKRIFKNLFLTMLVIFMALGIVACGSKEGSTKVAITSEEDAGKEANEKKIDYSKVEDFSVLEKTWKPKNHLYPEPPEDLKIYPIEGNNTSWVIPYKYKGVEVWVNGSNNPRTARMIFRKTSDNPDDINVIEDELVYLSAKSNLKIYETWGMLGVSKAAIDEVTDGAPIVNKTY